MLQNSDSSSFVVHIPGDILSTNAETVRDFIFSELGASGTLRDVTIDLSRAVMVDSVGLNLLVTVIKQTKRAGGSVTLRVGSQNVERTFRFTRLDAHATVVRV